MAVDVPDGGFRQQFLSFALAGELSGLLFQLIVAGESQDVRQYPLAFGGVGDGELVGVPLADVGAVDEGFVVHAQDFADLALCLPDVVAGDWLESVLQLKDEQVQAALSRCLAAPGPGMAANDAV